MIVVVVCAAVLVQLVCRGSAVIKLLSCTVMNAVVIAVGEGGEWVRCCLIIVCLIRYLMCACEVQRSGWFVGTVLYLSHML